MQKTNGNLREEESPALHFFLYLTAFFSLAFAISGVIAIVFTFIDKFIKDVSSVDYHNFYMAESAVKYGISAIIIAGIVYLLTARYINKLLFTGSIKEDSRARKWLTYIVMFVALAVILGDLVAILSNFLGGDDLATKFFLKALTMLLVASAVFGFYLWDMRKREIEGKKYKANLVFGLGLTAVFLALVIAPFFFISNPSLARKFKTDDATVDKLRNVDQAVQSYYWNNDRKKLPASLDKITAQASSGDSAYYSLREEDTKVVRYTVKGKTDYELCAGFLADSRSDFADIDYYNKQWQHKKGEQCFARQAQDKVNSYPKLIE